MLSMRRFFVHTCGDTSVSPSFSILNTQFSICGAEHNHLANVVRCKIGERVTVCCGDEYDYICEITKITKNSSALQLIERQTNRANPKAALTVFLAVIKHDNLGLVVQKLNELGAMELVLFNADRCNVNTKSLNLAKLNTIAEQSCKQCERSKPLKVSFTEKLDFANFDKVIFADEHYDKIPPSIKGVTREASRGFFSEIEIHKSEKVALVIGPEGGFTDEERNTLCAMPNVLPISLGARILRAETAAIATAAICMAKLGEI